MLKTSAPAARAATAARAPSRPHTAAVAHTAVACTAASVSGTPSVARAVLRLGSPGRALAACLLAGLAAGGALAGNPDGTRVILISVDGLRADAVSRATAPRLVEIRERGAHAREALSDLPAVTLPNHASMLTGLTAARHGVVLNRWFGGTIRYKTLVDYAHLAGLETAFFASKEKLGFLAREQTTHRLEINGNPHLLVNRLMPLLAAEGPDVIFLHLRDPDSTGHDEGWMSREYLRAVRQMDSLVGAVFDAVNTAPTRPTYMLVTADHGGEGRSHFANKPVVRRIPWIVHGPGIPAGLELPDTVSTTDTMPTLLWLLGLEVPAGLSGEARTELRAEAPQSAMGLNVPPLGPPCAVLGLPVFLWLFSRYRPGIIAAGRRKASGCEGLRPR